jgi:hypothetical protein
VTGARSRNALDENEIAVDQVVDARKRHLKVLCVELARFRKLEVDDLKVHKLRVIEETAEDAKDWLDS